MKVIRIGDQSNCSFCKKSQQVARWLIASPDQSIYIWDECTVELSRPKRATGEREAQREVSSSTSRVSRFLRKHTKSLRCSFCRKRLLSMNSYVPAQGCETQV